MFKQPLTALALLCACTASWGAEPWADTNLAITDRHILPRYQLLAEAGSALEQKVHALCQEPNERTLNGAREGFHQAMDAWQGIQHIRFGPVELFLRHSRYELWPDKHSTGDKQMRKLLAVEDEAALKADNFRHTSVAVQGLSALERLLFTRTAEPKAFGLSGEPSYRCHLAEAIGGNVAEMGQDLVNDWRENYRNEILTAETGNDSFEASQEVSAKLLNNLHTQLQAIVDQKLLRPMAEDAASAKPRRAESWRSRRSLRNIALNLEATREMYRVGFAPLLRDEPELAKRIDTAFGASIRLARESKHALYDSAAELQRRVALERLLEQTRELKRLVGNELPQALDLPLGFNSLDGD